MTTKFDFDGKLALVTGSSRGIGRVIATYLAQQGCDVVVHYRREAEAAEAVAESIRRGGRHAETIRADLAVAGEAEGLMNTIRERHGRLDFFIANAASTAFKTVDDTRPHHIELTFAVTIGSLVTMVQQAVGLMSGRQGKIVTISGMDATRFVPNHSTLGAAKAGVEALTRYFACEYYPRGVTVNGIRPGPTLTDSLAVMLRTRGAQDYVAALQERASFTAGGRLSRPEDIAPVAAFLCSDEAAWMVGQILAVDGGFSLGFDPYSDRPIEEITVETLEAER